MLSVNPSQTLQVSVTMLNTGSSTWNTVGAYKLGLYSTQYITKIVLSGAGDSSVNGTYNLPTNGLVGLINSDGRTIFYDSTDNKWYVQNKDLENAYYTNDLKSLTWQRNGSSPNPAPNDFGCLPICFPACNEPPYRGVNRVL